MTPYASSSRQRLEDTLAAARTDNDPVTEGQTLLALAALATEEEEYAIAQGLYGQAWAVYERMGSQRKAAMMLTHIAHIMVIVRPDHNTHAYDAILLSLLDKALTYFEAANDLPGQGAVWKVRANSEDKWERSSSGTPLSNQRRAELESRAYEFYKQAGDQAVEVQAFFGDSNPHETQVRDLCQQAQREREPSNDELTRERSPLTFLYLEQASVIYRQWGDTFKDAELIDQLGEYLYQIEDYPTAYQAMKQAITMPNRDPLQGLGRIATVAKYVGDYAAAQDYLEFELADLERKSISPLKHTLIRTSRLLQRAEIKALRGNITEGRRDYHTAVIELYQLPTAAQIRNQTTAFLFEWGKIEYAAGDRDVGYYYCSEAANRDIQQRTNHPIWAWRWAKKMEHMTHDLPEKSPLSRPTLESLTDAQQRGDLPAQAKILLALGHCARDEKELDLAQGLYGQALAVSQTLGDSHGQAEALVGSASLLLYGSTTDMRTASDFLTQALTLYQTLGDELAQAHLYVRLGFLLWNLNDHETRLPLYQAALTLLARLPHAADRSALALELAGSMYGHPDFAPLYEQAMQMHQQAEYERGNPSENPPSL